MTVGIRSTIIDGIKIDEGTGCWNWKHSIDRDGYGSMSFMGKVERAHRVSAHCFLRFDLKSSLLVLHRCDNPSCVNPQHLICQSRCAVRRYHENKTSPEHALALLQDHQWHDGIVAQYAHRLRLRGLVIQNRMTRVGGTIRSEYRLLS